MKTVYTVYRMDGRVVFITDPTRVNGRGRRVESLPFPSRYRYFSCIHCDNNEFIDFFDTALRALVGDI